MEAKKGISEYNQEETSDKLKEQQNKQNKRAL